MFCTKLRYRSVQRFARFGFATLIGLDLLTAYAKEPVMNETKTYCVGRFLVDVPKEAEINGQSYEFMFSRVESEPTNLDEKGFSAKMEKRESELREGKQKDEFKLVGVVSPSVDSRIFKLSRIYDLFPNDPPSTGLEAYRFNHGQIFSMTATGFNSLFLQIVEQLKAKVLPAIRARTPNEMPLEPGFCIKEGFIADDGSKSQREDAGISFRFARWPDLIITVSTSTVNKAGEPSLLQRIDSNPVPAIYASVAGKIKTLRRGKHAVHERKGEEILELLPTEAGFKQHSFRWEASGMVDKILSPDLVVEFESGTPLNGEPRRPSLTDEQATKLFDSIVNSIRLRPTGGDKHSAVEQPKKPLVILAATDAVCPQTGWWQCAEESRPVQGGRRQFFHAGNFMPRAVLLGDTSVWQKLKGEQPSHKLATVWKLVDYEATASIEPVQPIADVPIDATDKNPAPNDKV